MKKTKIKFFGITLTLFAVIFVSSSIIGIIKGDADFMYWPALISLGGSFGTVIIVVCIINPLCRLFGWKELSF